MHSIGPGSPLAYLDAEKFNRIPGEVLVLIKVIDESSGEVVYARTSYTSCELEFDACHQDMI